jgi:plasmid replication initiation protein
MYDIMDINNLTVVKHNRIIDAEYSMGVCEQRVLLTCISKIDSSKSMSENRIFSVSVDDIVDLVNVERSSAYPHLKKTCKALFTNTITVHLSDSPDPLITRWVDAVRYIEREGRIELRFTPEMIPFLTQISRDFTKYKLVHVLKFKSLYSYRLYEWLCRWGNTEHTFTVEWLREKFQLFDKYPKMADFKKDVIDVAVKEISATSDIKVTYEQIKKGRNIVAFRFIYTRTPDKKSSKGTSETLALPNSQPEKSEIAEGINIDIFQFNDKDKQLAKNALAKVSESTQRIILDIFKSALAKGDVKYPLRYLNGLVSKSLSGDLDITAFENVPATSSNHFEKQIRREDKIKQAFAKNTDEFKAKLATEGHIFIQGEGTISKSEFEELGLIEKAPRTGTKSMTLSELMDKAQVQENLRKEREIAQKKVEREKNAKQPKTVADIPVATMSEKEIAARQMILELEAQLIAAGEFVGVNAMAISEEELAGLAELEVMQTRLMKTFDKK